MRSQRIGRGFESHYLHHAKRQAFACLFAWWSLNGEYAAQQGFKVNKAKKCHRSHSRQRILTRVPASGKRQNLFISIISKHCCFKKQYSDSFYFTERRDAMKSVPSFGCLSSVYASQKLSDVSRVAKIIRRQTENYTTPRKIRFEKEVRRECLAR